MAPRREGRWLCPYCGSENLGRHESCEAHCGASRPQGVRFYLPENSPIVTDPALLADAASGQDWNCDHCDGANPGQRDGHPVIRCAHCGNGRDGDDTEMEIRHFAPGEVPRSAADLVPPRPDRRGASRTKTSGQRGTQSVSQGTSTGASLVAFLGLAAALICAALLITSFFVPVHHATGAVSALDWTRSIRIEKLVTETDEGWSLPQDARLLDEETRVKGHEEVVDHYVDDVRKVPTRIKVGSEPYDCGTTDLGNGYFEDKVCERDIYTDGTKDEPYKRPVMKKVAIKATWYRYEQDLWKHARTPEIKGSGTEPAWPAITLGKNEREASRREAYSATLTFDDGERRRQPIDLPSYRSLKVGDPVSSDFTIWGQTKGLQIGHLRD